MVALGQVALGALVALVGGGIGLRFARRNWRIRRTLSNAEGARAGSLDRGAVELAGTARPAAETFMSPLTGQECLAYQYEVEERQRRSGEEGTSRTTWQTVVDDERAAPFYVDDSTGRAMVDAGIAEFRLAEAYTFDSEDATAGAAERVVATLTGRDAEPDVPIRDDRLEEMRTGHRRRRYTERLILPGESVYVYGEAVPPSEIVAGGDGIGGAVAGVAGLLDSGESTSPLLGGALSVLSGGSEQFRRAKRQGPEDARESHPSGAAAFTDGVSGAASDRGRPSPGSRWSSRAGKRSVSSSSRTARKATSSARTRRTRSSGPPWRSARWLSAAPS